MPTYNEVAGKNIDRLAALSDGVFAFALTVIVVDIRLPSEGGEPTTDAAFVQALVHLAPSFATYLLSFLTLGIFWVGQQAQLNAFARSDRDLTWIHLGFLASIALLPLTTLLLAHEITLRSALVVYWFLILVLGMMLFWSWRHASARGLLKDDLPSTFSRMTQRRIVIAQASYFACMLLCLVNTYVSITCIILVQLNYALAPKIFGLHRI
jgi:uncharacterized membrane protein